MGACQTGSQQLQSVKRRRREARDIRSCPPRAKLLILKDFWQNRQQACSSNAAAGSCGYYQSLTGSRDFQPEHLKDWTHRGARVEIRTQGSIKGREKGPGSCHTLLVLFFFYFTFPPEVRSHSSRGKMAAGCGGVASWRLRGSRAAGPGSGSGVEA